MKNLTVGGNENEAMKDVLTKGQPQDLNKGDLIKSNNILVNDILGGVFAPSLAHTPHPHGMGRVS